MIIQLGMLFSFMLMRRRDGSLLRLRRLLLFHLDVGVDVDGLVAVIVANVEWPRERLRVLLHFVLGVLEALCHVVDWLVGGDRVLLLRRAERIPRPDLGLICKHRT